MFCTNCGGHQASATRFCGSCGQVMQAGMSQATVEALEAIPPAAVAPPSPMRLGYVPPSTAPPASGFASAVAPVPSTHHGAHTPGPSLAYPAVAGARPPVDNTLAWTLAFAPLLFVMLDGILLAAGVGEADSTISLWAAVAINCALGWADARRVRAAGYDVSAALAVLLVPVYLFNRASRLRQKLAIPIVWCVCALASLAGAAIVGNTVGVAIDIPAIEADIAREIDKQAGVTVSVECPSSASPKPGSSFQCLIEADGQKAIVDVTVQNTAGDFVWQVR